MRKTRQKLFISAILFSCCFIIAPKAYALQFDFSFSDTNGTVTGTIFGLVDNAANQQASAVTITSAPLVNIGLGEGADATQWTVQSFNTWTVVSNALTTHRFTALTASIDGNMDGIQFIGNDQEAILQRTSSGLSTYPPETVFVGFDPGIFTAGYTPNPVPEPTTFLLLGIGIAGLAGAEVRRRRKKKAVANS